jgi:hypothetical protein
MSARIYPYLRRDSGQFISPGKACLVGTDLSAIIAAGWRERSIESLASSLQNLLNRFYKLTQRHSNFQLNFTLDKPPDSRQMVLLDPAEKKAFINLSAGPAAVKALAPFKLSSALIELLFTPNLLPAKCREKFVLSPSILKGLGPEVQELTIILNKEKLHPEAVRQSEVRFGNLLNFSRYKLAKIKLALLLLGESLNKNAIAQMVRSDLDRYQRNIAGFPADEVEPLSDMAHFACYSIIGEQMGIKGIFNLYPRFLAQHSQDVAIFTFTNINSGMFEFYQNFPVITRLAIEGMAREDLLKQYTLVRKTLESAYGATNLLA